MIRPLCLILSLTPAPLAAQVLTLPGNATLEVDSTEPLDSYALPTGRFDDGTIPTREVEGAVTTQVWRVAASGLGSLQLLRPLRDQLRQAGYAVIFECETQACGGFDFRFGTRVTPPPAMQVDLADFRFLSAIRDTGGGPRAVSLLISRTPQAGYVQIIRAVPADAVDVPDLTAADAPVARAPGPEPTAAPADLEGQLTRLGHAVLVDVTFDTGAVTLADADLPALRALADYMADQPDLQVSIVGHTDSQGGLDGNIAISRQRASAVVDRLVSEHGVSRDRLTAAGMGYLAPIASNLDPAGREANRRVEAVVTGPID